MARCRLEIREGLPSAVVRGSGPPDTLSGLPMSDSPPAPDDTPAAGSSAAAHSFRAQAVLAGTPAGGLELERIWARLRDEFEIRERFAALHGKLALISRTAETALELLQNRRALRVEYAIVGLIVFEIFLTLLQWWLSGRVG